jgi:hypothetical protein
MTLNIPVNNQGIPHALNGERFLLYRQNIEFQVKIDGLGKKELKGTVILYTFRLFSPLIGSFSSAINRQLIFGLLIFP